MVLYGMCVEEIIAARLKLAEFEIRREMNQQGVVFDDDPLERVTESEAAKLLQLSSKTVQRRADNGHFRRYKDGGRIYYLKHELERYRREKDGVNISETV